MLFELISAFAAGFAAAGVAMLLRRLTGGALPRVVVPISAGLAMLGFAVWSEYSWRDRTVGALPDGLVEVRSYAEPSPYRPWTYLFPFATRFMAVDLAGARHHPAAPDQKMVEVLLFARHAPPRKIPVLIDCAARQRADLVDGVDFAADGTVRDADWRAMESEDPLFKAVCA